MDNENNICQEDHTPRAHDRPPVINILGEKVALGPYDKSVVETCHRWVNDFDTVRLGGLPIKPRTLEQLVAASVYLTTAAYNIAGQRAYKKAGFKEAGRAREADFMGGKFWDLLYMDCLASEFTSPVLARIFLPPETNR